MKRWKCVKCEYRYFTLVVDNEKYMIKCDGCSNTEWQPRNG